MLKNMSEFWRKVIETVIEILKIILGNKDQK